MLDILDLIKALERPNGKIKVVIDSDTFNEIDDQYAISYCMLNPEKFDVLSIYAAPFFNDHSSSPKDGMELSYKEIKNILRLAGSDFDEVYKGSEHYLVDERTPVVSDAAKDLVKKAMAMPDGEKLYAVCIAAITNIASALLIEPNIADKIVVVWLGGHSFSHADTREFNMVQDIPAARVLFDSGVPVIQFPCEGVTSHLSTTEQELRHYLCGKNPLSDYLYKITCAEAIRTNNSKCWSRVIWDILPFVWLSLGEDAAKTALVHSPICCAEGTYSFDNNRHFIRQAQTVNRDVVYEELFDTLAKLK